MMLGILGKRLFFSGCCGVFGANCLEARRGDFFKYFTVLAIFIATVGSGFAQKVSDTQFSIKRGFYDAPFEVVVSTQTAGATIKYTFDGSDPRTSVSAFSGPNPCAVSIDPSSTVGRRATPAVTLRAYAFKDGLEPTNVDTQTYIFLDQVITQGEIKPTGSYVFWTTSMDTKVTQDNAYQDIMHDALLAIPTMSVVMDWEDLFGTTGIHRGNNLAKADYEKVCSLELFYPELPDFAGFKGFQIDCGMRIQGGGGRWDNGEYDHKQSFGIRFRREYGSGTLKYPIFENAPFNSDSEAGEYDKIVLRSGHNKSWGATWDNIHTVYTRDQMGRDLQVGMSGIGSRGTFVHLYLNGIYWGLYNPSERADHAFSASYLGGTKEDYYSGKAKGGTVSGDSTRFSYWRSTVKNTTNFSELQQYLAVDEFIDMALIGAYANVGDYPQFYYGNHNNPGGPVYFYQWDIEDSFGGGSRRSGSANVSQLGSAYEFAIMWGKTADFRMKFADRTYRACYNDGVFVDENITKRWLDISNHIYLAIVGESARWGDERAGDPGTRYFDSRYHDLSIPVYTRNDHWLAARNAVTADLQGRRNDFINKLRTHASKYYPSINPPIFRNGSYIIDVLRKQVPAGYSVTIERDGVLGDVYYTTDGSDPRAPGGGIQGINGGSATTITINSTTNVKARTLNGSEWSALHEAVFFVDQSFDDLKMTEIMYNPLPVGAATNRVINRIVGNDIAGDNYNLARVEFAVSPPSAITENDILVISGAAIAENNGTFTVHHREGNAVILKQILTDEVSSSARGDLKYDGDRYEFVELKNTGATALNLSGITFTSGITYTFPDGTHLAPGAFAVIASQPADFASRYPGVAIIGKYAGRLDNSGEKLELSLGTGEFFEALSIAGNDNGRGRLDFAALPVGLKPGDLVRIERANRVSNNRRHRIHQIAGNSVYLTDTASDEGFGAKATFLSVINTINYDDEIPWQLGPDGLGFSLVPTEANPDGIQDDASLWRTSAAIHGSPGADDPEPPVLPAILVNEILAHTDWPQVDTIELYNPGSLPVDLSGWRLTDDRKAPNKYQIPAGAAIGAGGYFVIEADNDNDPLNTPPSGYFGGAFSLSSHGEEIYVLSPCFRYSHGFEFGASENGVSFGRYITSGGQEHFPAQDGTSFGGANNGPKVGPVVINEIMYNPPVGGHEFLELVNISASPVQMNHMGNNWIVSGVGFTFPDNIVMQPGEVLLLVESSITPSAFAVRYNVSAGVQIFNYSGRLDNGGERIRLRKPDSPDGDVVPYITVDEVEYGDRAPWPTAPDGNGPSLERIYPGVYGNDSINWRQSMSSGGTPGYATPSTAPFIAVGMSEITASVLQGQDAASTSFEVWNLGVDTLNYTISDDADWLDVPVSTGSSTGASDEQTHTIIFTTAGLPAGLHQATISISSPDAGNSPVTISVKVNVLTPQIGLSTGVLECSTTQYSNAPDQTFEVWNAGMGILSYTISENAGWLIVSPDYGTSTGVGEKVLHTVSFSTSSLPAGTYNAVITISDPIAPNNPQAIAVSMTVTTPVIALNTTSLAQSAGQGSDAPDQAFQVWNGGSGTLTYTISDNAAWLSVNPVEGSSTDPDDKKLHTVVYNTDVLLAGTYYATITIADPSASNSPRIVSVVLTVVEQPPFVAYNDLNPMQSINAPNVTGYDYSGSGPLMDFQTGEYLTVSMTGSYVPTNAYDPYGQNGGNVTNVDSDAYQAFNGIVDLTGVHELDYANWANIITFNNLKPREQYTITLTANRDDTGYLNQRYTRVTIEGAETYTNASSAGVIVNSEDSVSFSTGYNRINGYVARWTGVTTGPDGSFSIKSEWDDGLPGTKGYSMGAFKLEATGPARHPADLVDPLGIDFADYAAFGNWWLNTDCEQTNDCEGADFDSDGKVDFADLLFFTEHWLWGTWR